MERRDLADVVSETLIPLGFKRRGNYWVLNGEEITKMVNLQKSQFSNRFYINYGYIIRSIPSDGTMHVYNRLASRDISENRRIDELLDLEEIMPDQTRSNELKGFLLRKLVPNLQSVNTERDLRRQLEERPHLNDIPLVVKEHFDLKERNLT